MSTRISSSGSREQSTLSYDECFDLLSNHRRRYTLHYLEHNGDETALGDLSEKIAAWENDTTRERISYDQRKRVYTSLQQVHLPRMDQMGVVEYDSRQGSVRLDPDAPELDIYVEVVGKYDIPWSMFYLGLAILNLTVLGSVWVGVPGTGMIPDLGWVLFTITTFLVVSLCHLYITRTRMRLDSSGKPPELQH